MGVRHMTGAPWHPERMHREEGEERRSRSRCKFYCGKKSGECKYYMEKCHGAAHCDVYCVIQNSIEKKSEKNKPKTNTQNSFKSKKFRGFRKINMTEIVFDKSVLKLQEEDDIQRVIVYFQKHREFDYPVEVYINSQGKYQVKNDFLSVSAAMKMRLVELPVMMGKENEINLWKGLMTKGTLVWHKELEVGVVIDSTNSTTTIKYDDGKIQKYNIYKDTSKIRIL